MPYCHGDDLERAYRHARDGGYGFFASNVVQFDILVGLLRGADRVESDLVVQINEETAEFYGDGDPRAGLRAFGSYLQELAASKEVGVFCNIDHVRPDDEDEDEEFLRACVQSGIPSSVMVDASAEPFEANVERTRDAVELVSEAEQEILVEAELGRVAGEEGGVETTADDAFYTDPERAVEFVDRTGCDLLAISVGTQHGVASDRKLDVRPDVARSVDDALRDHGLEVPLVVHGSSGLTDEQVRAFVDAGVRKFNKNTRYQYEYTRTAFDYYRNHEDSIVPPDDVTGRETLYSEADWSPEKAHFHPSVAAEEVRTRLADVMAELAELTGSAGQSGYA
ncbi:class II fructose-bisphosphate aldolase [Natronoglomus mannanivorans]|uniref:Class II fructose-bisphosphate aldolase n=1 Tax=Natronoglomus mannanivorans TaxID=2979990 RepID=A0AAP2Z3S4_9EURY|nr:class II fructose-bisphosphate aldolase [Halobacteria archaeon AArc-xg1-1]